MNALLIDTTTNDVRVAVGLGRDESGGGRLELEVVPSDRKHSENLLVAVERVMEKAGLVLGELGLISVVAGPGSYTSLRVGVTTANVLAYSLGLPVVGVSWFEIEAGKPLSKEKDREAADNWPKRKGSPAFDPSLMEIDFSEAAQRAVRIAFDKVNGAGVDDLRKEFDFAPPFYLRAPDITQKRHFC